MDRGTLRRPKFLYIKCGLRVELSVHFGGKLANHQNLRGYRPRTLRALCVDFGFEVFPRVPLFRSRACVVRCCWCLCCGLWSLSFGVRRCCWRLWFRRFWSLSFGVRCCCWRLCCRRWSLSFGVCCCCWRLCCPASGHCRLVFVVVAGACVAPLLVIVVWCSLLLLALVLPPLLVIVVWCSLLLLARVSPPLLIIVVWCSLLLLALVLAPILVTVVWCSWLLLARVWPPFLVIVVWCCCSSWCVKFEELVSVY